VPLGALVHSAPFGASVRRAGYCCAVRGVGALFGVTVRRGGCVGHRPSSCTVLVCLVRDLRKPNE